MNNFHPPIPRQIAPSLSVEIVEGEKWSLQNASSKNFTLILFYRGWHCPVCRDQLRDLNSRMYDFDRLGVSVIAISCDDKERAALAKKEWGLYQTKIGYGLELNDARKWGLYISTRRGVTSLGVEEPKMFNEPGIFLVKPDNTLYHAAIQSAPFARPEINGVVRALEFILKNEYPARGEVVSY